MKLSNDNMNFCQLLSNIDKTPFDWNCITNNSYQSLLQMCYLLQLRIPEERISKLELIDLCRNHLEKKRNEKPCFHVLPALEDFKRHNHYDVGNILKNINNEKRKCNKKDYSNNKTDKEVIVMTKDTSNKENKQNKHIAKLNGIVSSNVVHKNANKTKNRRDEKVFPAKKADDKKFEIQDTTIDPYKTHEESIIHFNYDKAKSNSITKSRKKFRVNIPFIRRCRHFCKLQLVIAGLIVTFILLYLFVMYSNEP